MLVLFACEVRVHVVAFMGFVVLCLKHLAKGGGATVNKCLLMARCGIDGLEACFGNPGEEEPALGLSRQETVLQGGGL